MSTEKPGNFYKRQRERLTSAYAEASSIRERFPQLEQLVLEFTFTDLQGTGSYSPQTHSLAAAAKAYFAVPCPRTLCLDGGFDLDAFVRAMLKSKQGSAKGTLICQGCLDPARKAHSSCGLRLEYRVEARYDEPALSQSGARRAIG
jgi:hypothetical protein